RVVSRDLRSLAVGAGVGTRFRTLGRRNVYPAPGWSGPVPGRCPPLAARNPAGDPGHPTPHLWRERNRLSPLCRAHDVLGPGRQRTAGAAGQPVAATHRLSGRHDASATFHAAMTWQDMPGRRLRRTWSTYWQRQAVTITELPARLPALPRP